MLFSVECSVYQVLCVIVIDHKMQLIIIKTKGDVIMNENRNAYGFKKTYRFSKETIDKINKLKIRYNIQNSTDMIRTLINNEYNRLCNPQADPKTDPVSELKAEIIELKKKINIIDKSSYETRDMVNTILCESEYEGFTSADDDPTLSSKSKKYSNALINSRENYKQKLHNNSVNSAVNGSIRKLK